MVKQFITKKISHSLAIEKYHWTPKTRDRFFHNGFTLLEMLVVLFIVSILLSVSSVPFHKDSLAFFSRNLLLEIQTEQFKAFESRQNRQFVIERNYYQTTTEKVDYPNSISCTPQVLLFTSKGNISKGGTVVCSQGTKQVRLVFQIGTGKGRIDAV